MRKGRRNTCKLRRCVAPRGPSNARAWMPSSSLRPRMAASSYVSPGLRCSAKLMSHKPAPMRFLHLRLDGSHVGVSLWRCATSAVTADAVHLRAAKHVPHRKQAYLHSEVHQLQSITDHIPLGNCQHETAIECDRSVQTC